ncbi:sugar transporter SWEET1 [Neocloeon triangulifer]|uniref:sugar transporter SWEET1 n=1 Tax=Neocloeon triangulifer TaxID=2078957 RepID=UPI00286F73F6|nr:sugar transporter SWEET1 [Neocloeon triangulifer]XP_059478185.1 sugar transporter SWEET1 [Neocloeon triangulifer]
MVLDEYKDLVGAVASVTTILQFFSGVFVCLDIKKKGNSGSDSVLPFLGGCVIGALNLKYSFLLADSAMTVVSAVGVLINLGYLAFYYAYSNCKGEVNKAITQGVIFALSLLFYAQFWEDPELVEDRFGAILTVLMLLLLASPLLSLGEVIRTQSTASLPFPIILASTVVTFEWLLYGIIIDNIFIQIQNGVGLALCALQLSLFAIYPRTPVDKKKD